MRERRSSVIVGAFVALSIALVGCTATPPAPTETSASAAPSASPTPTATPDPVFDPAQGATGNQVYFDFVNKRLIAANSAADGTAFVDSLVAAGFDKTRMEVTYDRTAVDLQADSITFSVRFDDACLVGQYGGVTGYLSAVRPPLTTGRCFVGTTRPIDW